MCSFWVGVDQAPLQEGGVPVFLVGGAEKAAELDAKRAIDQGIRLAAVLENAKTGEVFNAPDTLKAKVRMDYTLARSDRIDAPQRLPSPGCIKQWLHPPPKKHTA